MTATATQTAAPAAAVRLTLDDRLALTGLAMDSRLDHATADMAIRTAHIDIPDVEIGPPILPAPNYTPAPASTPTAELLQQARQHMAAVGWTRGRRRDEQGGVCLIGALHAAARGGHISDAADVLLDAIRREFAGVTDVVTWNDQQRDGHQPLRMLDKATLLADARGV